MLWIAIFMGNPDLCESAWKRMDNEQRAASLLNVYTSKAIEEYVVGEHIDLFKIYVVRLSGEDANRIYVKCIQSMFVLHW